MKIKETKKGKNLFSGYIESEDYINPEIVVHSWEDCYSDRVAANSEETGLRQPQFGALCAIRSYWTVNKRPATVVMPTGTGKTETMLATIVAEKVLKTLIVVPSHLLRRQMYDKAKSLGMLYDLGVVKRIALEPNIFMLVQGIKDFEIFKNNVDKANIIITTMTLADRLDERNKIYLADKCDVLIVDEAHHISSKTWSRFREYFYEKRILQFTATPFRNDGKKLDGDIIYNFPLVKAQEQGYFEEIEFIGIEEFDDSKSDITIAEKAVEQLVKDMEAKYEHILLVRAKNINRAEELYKKIYSKKYKKYNPVLITSRQTEKEKKERLDAIRTLNSRIIVCVDMFGEGIDVSNLKVAAIHDKYKSLPITLQFIGRFARTKKGLGKAKVVANIADDDIVESLKDLYDRDSDWNKLLPIKSNEYIDSELSLQKLASGFHGANMDLINIKQMRPKVSMIAYIINSEKWNWENWTSVFDENICRYSVNNDEKILIIIEPRKLKVGWTTQRDISNLEWEFYIVYWNKEKGVAFANSTDKSKAYRLVNAIFGNEVSTVKNEQIFKCLYGIKRLMLGTVGLNSAIDGPIRYKMFAGVDIAHGIAESSKDNCYKSNIFGIGYQGDGKISIGCSYKGTIWSRWVESIDYWVKWCNEVIDKIFDPTIDVSKIMEGVLIPKTIKQMPEEHAYRIDWPLDLDFETERSIFITNITGEYTITNVDIRLEERQSTENSITFFVENDSFSEKFVLMLDDNNYTILSVGKLRSKIKIGYNSEEELLSKFFQLNPPTIWFVNGSSLEGNLYVELSNCLEGVFPDKNIIRWNWEELGTNIKIESQLDKENNIKKKDSIQYAVIYKLKEEGIYSIIFDDDGPGEVADVVAIEELEKSIRIHLFHCKYSHEDKPGSRVNDLYEVCGQAEKSVHWKQNPVGMIDNMIRREIKRTRNGELSRFEVGSIQELKEIQNKLKMRPVEMTITIVQPGVDSYNITEAMHRVLVSTQSYCLDTFSISVDLICS